MKVYFTASARGVSNHLDKYKLIFSAIEKNGNQNLDKLILEIDGRTLYNGEYEDQVNLYERTTDLIKKADVVILEVSVPSLSMGFVVHKALEMSKSVILLYQSGFKPFFS